MMNKKTQRIVIAVIAVVLVVTMVAGMFLPYIQ